MEEHIISAIRRVIELDAKASMIQAEKENELEKLQDYYKGELERYHSEVEKDKKEAQHIYSQALLQVDEKRKIISTEKEENIKKICTRFGELREEMSCEIIRKLLL